MNVLNIVNIKPGMILAQPVRNHQGVLLLEAGARITNKNIRIFKSWGVNEVAIKGDRPDLNGDAGESEHKRKELIEKQLKEKFSDVLNDPVMVEIFNAASKQLMRDFQNHESENERS